MNPWEWLDGRKTVIGTVALFAGAFIDQVVAGMWDVTWQYLGPFGSTLDWFGMALGGTGLVHRHVKIQAEKKAGEVPPPTKEELP